METICCCAATVNRMNLQPFTPRDVHFAQKETPGLFRVKYPVSVSDAPENLKVMVSQGNRTVLENFRNGTSLPVLEGQSLRLLCVAHSNPPARLSWARGGQTLSPSQPSDPGVLELPQIQTEHEGEFTCGAQNPLGSQNISLSLSVVCEPPAAAGTLLLPGG
ncbi:Sialic acid-binding Ig-like lectin 16, partial [Eschrichtius robustus]|nr:Sialic acid-binding Ig-like lectin 16 [Eschrichtius robustus]